MKFDKTGSTGKFPPFLTRLRHLLIFVPALLSAINANAQISGTVFRDFNGNGTRENSTGTFVEPLSPGVIVTAYNSSDVILASFTTTGASDPNYTIPASGTAYNGTKGSGTGFVANNVAVRLEFTIPANTACLVSGVYDFTSKAGKVYGTSVRFLASSGGARTGNHFAFNNPNDYVAGANPKTSTYIFQALQFGGNPLTGSGTSATKNALIKIPYSRSGTTALTTPSEILATTAQVGSIYGVAYSKHAQKVFTSAFMKRHTGFGPADGSGAAASYAPGTIYIINPSLNSASPAASFFISLDKKGFPTHNATGSPSYANAYSLSSTETGSLRTETVTYSSNGLGVIGTNAERGLGINVADPSNDPAAFDQAGKVSLGDIEVSDDGKFLFVVNLYDRKIYQFLLNSVTNPTDASYVNSWSLPNPPARSGSGLPGAATTYASSATINDFYNGVRGIQRPFGLKYHRGKLYVGAVTTGEGEGALSTIDDYTGDTEYTDLWSYVWELTPSTGFTASPVLQFPLNYPKGIDQDNFDERWRPWSNTMPRANVAVANGGQWSLCQPMLAGIEFDVEGSMILAFRDRSGDQGGAFNHMLSGTTSRTAMAFGDQLRAFKNPTGCTFELEYNAKEGPGSSRSATSGANNGQGPGGGEFYFQDGIEVFNGGGSGVRYHLNTAMGGLALLPGMEEVTAAYMDAMALLSSGISWMNNRTGANPRDYLLYQGFSVGEMGKANSLGDIELLFENPPIEIGNRVWKDLNGDGLQGAEEPGIGGVLLELVTQAEVAVGTVTTASDGTWYFSSETGTDEVGIKYGVSLEPGASYKVRLATTGAGNDWDPAANGGAGGPRTGGELVGLLLTGTNKSGNGEADFSDSDAALVSATPEISLTLGGYGENNHTYDIGFYDPTALPVTLLNFNGKADDAGDVRLAWTTTEESKSSHFEIQRSKDGASWGAIGRVSAQGESKISQSYNFTDRSPLITNNLYRLKMVDLDANFAYSRIVNVRIESALQLMLFPNPASDRLSIASRDGNAVNKVQVYSLIGKLLQEVTAPKNGEVSVKLLTSGVYILKVTKSDGSVEIRRFSVAH